jgi:glyceraldehyde-3-phosphate dehydrogenase (NADP+)
MELGSNSPFIIMPDADIARVVKATVSSGYSNAGQVCISAQRIITSDKLYADYLDALKEGVEAITTGNPLDESVRMGPMIRERDAIRVNEWIKEAVGSGARVVTGGERSGTMHQPTVVADVSPEMRISCEELFGPAVAVTPFSDIDEAIAMANDTIYGLSAAIFTQNLDWAMKFAREVASGNLHINSGPQYRADLMPYGGLKDSGMGKEGPRYAVQEMTELKMVVFHL